MVTWGGIILVSVSIPGLLSNVLPNSLGICTQASPTNLDYLLGA
jgi:hypothetical protein